MSLYEMFLAAVICVGATIWGLKSFYQWAYARGMDEQAKYADAIHRYEFDSLKDDVKALKSKSR